MFSSTGVLLETLWVYPSLPCNLCSQKNKAFPWSLVTNGGNKWDFEGEPEKCPGSFLWSGYNPAQLEEEKATMELRRKKRETNRGLTRIQIIRSFIGSNPTSHSLFISNMYF